MDLTAAQSVLGSMLIDADVVAPVLGIVRPEDFELEAYRELFEGIRAMYRAGKPIDALTVADWLGWRANKDKSLFLAELMEVTPTSANALEYARIVHDDATLRAIHVQADVLRMAGTLEDCRAPLIAATEALDAGEKVEARSLGEMLNEFGTRQLSDAAHEYIGLGFEEIDRNSYLERGDVLMIGGAPSDGKTALALQIAWHMAAKYRVGFYSLETRYEKIEDRLVAVGMGLSFEHIKNRNLSQEEWDAYAVACGDAAKRRLTVIQASGMTADQISASSRARGFDVIFVDYGQLVRPEAHRGATRAEQMAGVSIAFHCFAQTTQTLVVLLLQLSRKERGSTRERDMFDLGESSQFERDADMVLLLSRPVEGKNYIVGGQSLALDTETARILRVAKQKEGRRVTLPLHFDGEHQRFAPLSPEPSVMARKFSAAGRAAQDRNRAEMRQMRFEELPDEEGMPF